MARAARESFAQHRLGFEFGSNRLWTARVESMCRAELCPELAASDVLEAAKRLAKSGVTRRDEIEPLPEDYEGFWISSPAPIT